MIQLISFPKKALMTLSECLGFSKRKMDPHMYLASMTGDVEALMWKLNESPLILLQTTPSGDTILHISARNGQQEFVSQLLLMPRKGSKSFLVKVFSLFSFGTLSFWRARNRLGNTALHEAAKAGHAGAIIAILDHDKGTANLANQKGERPLSLACTHGNCEAIQPFLNHGLSCVKKRRNDGQTCLHSAVLQGNLEVLKLLVENSKQGIESLKVRDSFGSTTLHSAVDGGRVEVVQYILQKSPKLVYTVNNLGRAPLHLAAIKGDIEIVKVIVKERPDCIDMTSKDGKTILHFAVQSHQIDLVEWISTQHYYKFWGDETDNNGNSPLHLATVYSADEKILKTLLTVFPRPTVKAVNKQGFTCLDLVYLSKNSQEKASEAENILRAAGAFTAEDAKERDVLKTSKEQKDRYSRVIETNAVIAALFATFAVTGPADKVVGNWKNFVIYMVSSNIAFYSSITVILVWILLEPLSRTRESSWIQGSMYLLGFMVPATALSFFIAMFNYIDNVVKFESTNDKRDWRVVQVLSSIMVPVLALVWIVARMMWAYHEARRDHKENIRLLIKRSISRLLGVVMLPSLLYLLLLGYVVKALIGIALLIWLFRHRFGYAIFVAFFIIASLHMYVIISISIISMY